MFAIYFCLNTIQYQIEIDLLKDIGLRLTNESSPTSRHLMQDMGWHPSYGLGKYLQGRKSLIIQRKKMNTEGLGFS
ncbi:hypothetical protein EI005_25555 [Escherichia coli]|nr:hypothetical protein [Escherichia coli]